MIKVTGFPICGPKRIVPHRHSDERGFFAETFNEQQLAEAGIAESFVQDNYAFSKYAGTVRGLHFQSPPYAQSKILWVGQGRILDVAIDMRLGSPTFSKHVAVELSAENFAQLYIPAGFAHGYCTLVPNCGVHYKVSKPYMPQFEGGGVVE